MRTKILPADSPSTLRYALDILSTGGLVAFPTDTVYGLGAMAFDGSAIKSIYPAKKRPAEKAIPVLIGSLDELSRVSAGTNEMALRLAARYWPGPLTLVISKHPGLPPAISAGPTVGVRIPDHPVAIKLLLAAGPMAVTSANLSAQTSPTTACQVLEQMDGRIPLVIDGGRTPGGKPSTVVDCLGPEPRILREGPISLLEMRQFLGLA